MPKALHSQAETTRGWRFLESTQNVNTNSTIRMVVDEDEVLMVQT